LRGFFCGMKFDIFVFMNFKNTSIIVFLFSVLLLCCKSTRSIHFQSEIPIKIEAPYYQSWVAGTQGGGSGVDVFLPVQNLNGIAPDSLHFRGQRVQAESKNKMIFGRFSTSKQQLQDVILSNEPLVEINNQLLSSRDHSPFDLAKNACVLSYKIDQKRYYYKIINLAQRPTLPYPSSPPSR